MTPWHNRFLSLAEYISSWSKDPSTKVGAVIVDDNNRVISTGYNGFARHIGDWSDRLESREQKLKLTLHAEINAILFAKQDLSGLVLYCTHPPCTQCASMIIQSGITHVYYYEPTEDFLNRWEADFHLTKIIFYEADMYFEAIRRN